MNIKKIRIVREGYPFIGISLLITIFTLCFFGLNYSVIFAVLTCYFAYFFRNPGRETPLNEELLYSPADGKITAIEEYFDDEYLESDVNIYTTKSGDEIAIICQYGYNG